MKRIPDEEISIDKTPMIDIVFLLLIFFMLMPIPKEKYLLDSDLPQTGETGSTNEVEDEPLYINFQLKSKEKNPNEIVTYVYMNNSLEAQFHSLSQKRLDEIEQMPQEKRNEIIRSENEKDRSQYHHDYSTQVVNMMGKMDKYASGYDKNHVKVFIDVDRNVPYKAMLAVMNLSTGNNFKRTTFMRPDDSIFNPD